jgi:hypothetical protein
MKTVASQPAIAEVLRSFSNSCSEKDLTVDYDTLRRYVTKWLKEDDTALINAYLLLSLILVRLSSLLGVTRRLSWVVFLSR